MRGKYGASGAFGTCEYGHPLCSERTGGACRERVLQERIQASGLLKVRPMTEPEEGLDDPLAVKAAEVFYAGEYVGAIAYLPGAQFQGLRLWSMLVAGQEGWVHASKTRIGAARKVAAEALKSGAITEPSQSE